jgi:hypothetical protein
VKSNLKLKNVSVNFVKIHGLFSAELESFSREIADNPIPRYPSEWSSM